MIPSFEENIETLFKTKHNAVYDPEYQEHLKKAPWEHWLSQNNYFEVTEEYKEAFINWIGSTKKNSISKESLLKYPRQDITVGTTQSFDEAYFRYSNRRLRIFRGEYAYHKRCFKNWAWLDKPLKTHPEGNWDEPLGEKDWVIVSHPFCGTGTEHPKLKELLDQCLKKQTPVLMDCAWFGTCFDLDFDWEHSALTEVAFSLSKGIGLGSMRTGLRFSRHPLLDEKPIAQQNKYKHLVLDNCQIGIYQMSHFDPDWSSRKYLNWYKSLCSHYRLLETKCLHISLLPFSHPHATHFLINESYAKVGVREALKALRQNRIKLEVTDV